MTTAEIIAACARDGTLPFLIIGGLAVIAHGYPRETVDLDFLVKRDDRDRWRQALAGHGYEIAHEHQAFAQFTCRQGWIDLDLMFVNQPTFDAMMAASVEKSVGPATARFVSLQHLLALKLHAAKQNLPHRILGDMDDIVNLVLVNRIDLRQNSWRLFFQKYGNLELYEKCLHATAA